jgi:anti-sigma factor RsiW
MDCPESRNRLQAYLDLELDLPSVVAIDRHLASCAACKALFARQTALRSGVRRHAQYYSAPSALAERIRAKIGATQADAAARTPKARRPWPDFRQWLPLGAAVAAAAVVSWTAAIQYASLSDEQVLAEQVVSGHARSVLSARLVDVASSDQHTVKPWLSSKLDFSPPVTDLTGEGFPLVGGRLDYMASRPVATLVYRHREHVIDLFIWPDARTGRDSPMRSFAKQGYNILHWTRGGMAFWAISDVNPAEMKVFAETYASTR